MINVNFCLTELYLSCQDGILQGLEHSMRMAHRKGSYVDPLAGGWNILGLYMTWGGCFLQQSDSCWQCTEGPRYVS